MSDEFLTPRRTSELLKVTTKTLQNWDKEGKIKSFRTTGGHRRFALADIRTLINRKRTNHTNSNKNLLLSSLNPFSKRRFGKTG